MKANEAPEKIYINPNIENRIWLIGNGDISFIEYTRTNAFIEKAKKYIANHFLAPGMDNEIKDFVNYMKEK